MSTATDWLADGLAAQIARWTTPMGSTLDSARLMRAVRELALAACDGHVCLPLAGLGGMNAIEARRVLLASGTAVESTSPTLATAAWPLVVDGEQLYLRAFFDLETRLAAAIDALVPAGRLTLISGGPGTGKTTAAAALIADLLEREPDLRIALAAPTGKAAARMREALTARARDLPEALRARLPAKAHTLHRLLGVTSAPGRFQHHAANPLALDLLIVDEASMLDLALAASLVDALPAHARLVLLGDKDQLAAVEAGAVFADLTTLDGAVTWLTESHRFRADSGIGRLAREINAGEATAALTWLKAADDPAAAWIEDEDRGDGKDAPPSAATLSAMENGYAAYFAALREKPAGETPDARAVRLFTLFDRFRVLVAVHEGPRGLAAINAHLERRARAALGISPTNGAFWAGRPLIILKNDPVTRLFNGDIGLCLPGPDGTLQAYFPTPDGGCRPLPPRRLPEHDTAFALTVHKSQGSEFAEILLLLPARPVRVLSRELLYTAVTRAQQRVAIAGRAAVFEAGCAARSERHSGLAARLQNDRRKPHPASAATSVAPIQ